MGNQTPNDSNRIDSGSIDSETRRKLIKAGVLGGTGALAGCIGGDDETPTPTPSGNGDDDGNGDGNGDTDTPTATPEDIDGAYVEGQTLVMPFSTNPEELHFISAPTSGIESNLEFSSNIWRATHEMPVWGRWWGRHYWVGREAMGDSFPQLIEEFEIDGRTISAKIEDDAMWSDGTPVTARDALAKTAFRQRPSEENGWDHKPGEIQIQYVASSFEAPDGLDGKRFSFSTPDNEAWREVNGYDYDYTLAMYWFGSDYDPRLNVAFPTHWGPFDDMAEDWIEKWDNQEWDSDKSHAALVEPHLSAEDLEASREDPPPTNGAWMIDEVVGTEGIRLKPNPHFRHADRVNFDEVFFEFSAEEQRTIASIANGRLDSASVSVTADVADAFPDSIEEILTPSSGAISLNIDFAALNRNSDFRPAKVRQAIMYALDKEAIARNVHETARTPIYTPGGDTWGRHAVVSDEWVEENLVTYEQDLDKATELLEDVGWSLEDGTWYTTNDYPVETGIVTTADTPRAEPTVRDQLNDFGFELEVEPIDSELYVDRVYGAGGTVRDSTYYEEEYAAAGDADMYMEGSWTGPWLGGFFGDVERHYTRDIDVSGRIRKRNKFDHEAQERVIQETGGSLSSYWDLHDFLVEIPPLGEPDAEPMEIPFYTLQRAIQYGPYDRTHPMGRILDADDEYQGDYSWYRAPHDEPHPENGTYYWQWLLWMTNWNLPALPLAQAQNQRFINTANWRWPNELNLGDDVDTMWDYFGESIFEIDLIGSGLIQADPDNPKEGAEVVDR